jgi:hypothetical protein
VDGRFSFSVRAEVRAPLRTSEASLRALLLGCGAGCARAAAPDDDGLRCASCHSR